jgi:hypothetical protein
MIILYIILSSIGQKSTFVHGIPENNWLITAANFQVVFIFLIACFNISCLIKTSVHYVSVCTNICGIKLLLMGEWRLKENGGGGKFKYDIFVIFDFFIVIWVGIHYGIYKSSYNVSNI